MQDHIRLVTTYSAVQKFFTDGSKLNVTGESKQVEAFKSFAVQYCKEFAPKSKEKDSSRFESEDLKSEYASWLRLGHVLVLLTNGLYFAGFNIFASIPKAVPLSKLISLKKDASTFQSVCEGSDITFCLFQGYPATASLYSLVGASTEVPLEPPLNFREFNPKKLEELNGHSSILGSAFSTDSNQMSKRFDSNGKMSYAAYEIGYVDWGSDNEDKQPDKKKKAQSLPVLSNMEVLPPECSQGMRPQCKNYYFKQVTKKGLDQCWKMFNVVVPKETTVEMQIVMLAKLLFSVHIHSLPQLQHFIAKHGLAFVCNDDCPFHHNLIAFHRWLFFMLPIKFCPVEGQNRHQTCRYATQLLNTSWKLPAKTYKDKPEEGYLKPNSVAHSLHQMQILFVKGPFTKSKDAFNGFSDDINQAQKVHILSTFEDYIVSLVNSNDIGDQLQKMYKNIILASCSKVEHLPHSFFLKQVFRDFCNSLVGSDFANLSDSIKKLKGAKNQRKDLLDKCIKYGSRNYSILSSSTVFPQDLEPYMTLISVMGLSKDVYSKVKSYFIMKPQETCRYLMEDKSKVVSKLSQFYQIAVQDINFLTSFLYKTIKIPIGFVKLCYKLVNEIKKEKDKKLNTRFFPDEFYSMTDHDMTEIMKQMKPSMVWTNIHLHKFFQETLTGDNCRIAFNQWPTPETFFCSQRFKRFFDWMLENSSTVLAGGGIHIARPCVSAIIRQHLLSDLLSTIITFGFDPSVSPPPSTGEIQSMQK